MERVTNEFTITVDAEALAQNASGTVVGPVWLTLGGAPFPERGWHDLVVPFVLSLKESTERIAAGSPTETVDFFEGPFRLSLRRRPDGDLEVRTSRRPSSPGFGVIVDLDTVLKETADAAADIVAACLSRGWDTAEVNHLAG